MEINIPESQPVYSISTAARILGISVHTLRMYEKEGLILPGKSEGNQRLYSQSDLERILCIRRTINHDKISIAGIKGILSLIPCWKLLKCNETSKTCNVFSQSMQPCWAVKKKPNKCFKKDCKSCCVYIGFGNCKSIKEKIIELTNHAT